MQHVAFKICMIGDFAVGKTSLVRRFLFNQFLTDYHATIGVNISKKEIVLAEPEPVRVTFVVWDLAGGEPFSPIIEAYYRGASGALFVADISRPATVEHLAQYIREFRTITPNAAHLILLNKDDLFPDGALERERAWALAQKLDEPILYTSARTGHNVEKAFLTLARLLMETRDDV